MRLYKALLHLFPRSFRAEYGGEMMKDFSHQWTAASGGARILLIVTTVVDVAANAARVHADMLVQDLKYAARSLRRTPGFTLTAILVSAIGIGATTAAFTLADHVLIRALPFHEPDRLVKLWEDHTSRGYPRMEPSPPDFRDWQRQATSFERLEAYTLLVGGGSLTGHGDAIRLTGSYVTPGTMQMLGRQAEIGRIITDSDGAATQGDSPIVISDRLWRASFGATPDILNQTLTLDGATFKIIGVMPADFYFPSRQTDFWRPLTFLTANGDDDRTNHYLDVVGRLKPGVSPEQALAEMKQIGASLERTYPKELEGVSVTLVPWRDVIAQQPKMLLLALVGASICVLLIACTNLANLLMSRALARRSEFAVRAAVGASVDRLVRQMLTDSFVLALCGGVLGIATAVIALPLLVLLVPTSLPIAEVPPLDLRMLAGTLALTTITGLAFGLLPALRVCRRADGSALKDGARGGANRGTERLRSTLVIAEIVASVVLIVCVGLLSQALFAVQRVNPGFVADNVLTMRTQLPAPKFLAPEARLRFYSQVLDRVHALPGVTSASYISWLPMTFRGGIWEVLSTTEDAKAPGGFQPLDANHSYSASIRYVTPGFFETMRTPIVRGRDVAITDTLTTPFVAVVSESFARRHYPNQDPIGQSFAIGFAARTIVGVVGDIKVRGLERLSEPQVYLPAAQQNNLFFYAPKDLVVRASVPLSSLTAPIRSIIRDTEPDLPVTAIQPLEQLIALETAPRLVQLRVLGGFAAIALLLAAIGIHGLLGYTVSSRTREIGVRIALGAKRGDIIWMIIGRSAALAAAGVAIGAVLAYAAGRAMQSLLFGINPADLPVFAGAIGVALVMALAGSVLPAWRAVRIDPITATRTE
jgi:putative ABC transport system permease protein